MIFIGGGGLGHLKAIRHLTQRFRVGAAPDGNEDYNCKTNYDSFYKKNSFSNFQQFSRIFLRNFQIIKNIRKLSNFSKNYFRNFKFSIFMEPTCKSRKLQLMLLSL